jgi:pimeloyl-ACP methyl ester carboxylesterase
MTSIALGASPTPAQRHPVRFVEVCGHRLEYVDIPANSLHRPPLIFMHEGLGSVAMWRDFPARVAAATGCRTVVYSRHGHGRSSPSPGPHTVRFMHEEALQVLPAVREALGLARPVLVGHSTGASMSLIHAGAGQSEVAGVVAMAPLCFVEEFNLQSIGKSRHVFRSSDMKQKLSRYHDDAEAVFWSWNNIWLDPAFKQWSIEDCLPGIRCPVLAILGEGDEYCTQLQIDAIVKHAANSPSVGFLKLADCGHQPQRDQPERVIASLMQFINEVAEPNHVSR